MADPANVVPQSIRKIPVITPSSAYAAGNSVGGAIAVLAGDPTLGTRGFIQSVALLDADGQDPSVDVFFFIGQPGAGFTDKSAVALSKADLQALAIGVAQITSYALGAASTMGIGQALNLAKPFVIQPGQSLFAAIVSRGTPTWTAANSLMLVVDLVP